jgi:hypothetical protein
MLDPKKFKIVHKEIMRYNGLFVKYLPMKSIFIVWPKGWDNRPKTTGPYCSGKCLEKTLSNCPLLQLTEDERYPFLQTLPERLPPCIDKEDIKEIKKALPELRLLLEL